MTGDLELPTEWDEGNEGEDEVGELDDEVKQEAEVAWQVDREGDKGEHE